jgi:Ca2+-dependent lipid-binding protein
MVFDKKLGDKKSTIKKDNCNPEYNETFHFEIPDNMGLTNLVLECKVMDDDPLKDDKLGACKIKLDELNLSKELLGVERVIDDNLFTKDARIYLKLAYST